MRERGKHFVARLGAALLVASTCLAQQHQGIVLDATTNHIVVTGGMTPAKTAAGKRDPRIMQLLRRRARVEEQRGLVGGISLTADDLGISDATVAPATAIEVQGKTTQVTENRKIDWRSSPHAPAHCC